MLHFMSSPTEDDIPELPEEEFEMVKEELEGHPIKGHPDDRIVAIKQRIKYLRGCVSDLLSQCDDSGGQMDRVTNDMLQSYKRDLAEASKQLTEWQLQQQSRN
jgi:hypothetical protein